MPNPEDVGQQQKLLAAYRRSLAVSLEQLAQQSKAYATPGLLSNITEAQDNIQRIKTRLRKQGVEVEDFLIDEAAPQEILTRRANTPYLQVSRMRRKWSVGIGIVLFLVIIFVIGNNMLRQNGIVQQPTQVVVQTSLAQTPISTQYSTIQSTPMSSVVANLTTQLSLSPTNIIKTNQNPSVATIVAISTEKTATSLASSAQKIYGSVDFELVHDAKRTSLNTYNSQKILKNFILEARFYNPYTPTPKQVWSYGFQFRADASISQEYRLILQGNKNWSLVFDDFKSNNGELKENEGTIPDLNVAFGQFNDVRLFVSESTGLLYVNDKYVATLNVSKNTTSKGVITVDSDFYYDEITGKVTRVENFTIYSIN